MCTAMSYEASGRQEEPVVARKQTSLTLEERQVAQLLRQAMRVQEYTYAVLEERTGIPKSTVQGIMEGKSRTTLIRYAQLARVLGVSLDTLVPSKNPSPREEIARLLPVIDDKMIRSIRALAMTYAAQEGLLPQRCT